MCIPASFYAKQGLKTSELCCEDDIEASQTKMRNDGLEQVMPRVQKMNWRGKEEERRRRKSNRTEVKCNLHQGSNHKVERVGQ